MISALIIFTLLIAINTIYIAKNKYGFWLNHYTLHNCFWLLTIILSYYFNEYLVPVNNSIYLIFIFGLLAFNVSIIFIPNYKHKLSRPVLLSLKRRRIVEFTVIGFTIPQAYLNYTLLQQGVALWEINQDFWTNAGGGLYLYEVFRQSVVAPLSQVLIATCFFTNYYDTKKYSHVLSISIAILLGVINLLSTGGGRTGILHLGFMLALAFGASYNIYVREYLAKISKTIFIFIIIICVLGVSWATINRGHDSVLQEFVNRYTLCTPLFEYYYTSPLLDTHTYGSSTFEFIVTLFTYPLRLIGYNPDIVYNNSIIQEGVFVPALDGEVNAYATEYFNYIRDWGLLGVIIGPLILAYIYNWFYRKFRKNCFLMLFFVAGILSWNLESHFAFLKNNCLSIIYCLIIYKFLKKS